MEKTLALFHEHGTRKIYITMYSEVFHWAIKTQREYNFVIFRSCQLKIIFQSIMWLLLIGQIDQADKWQSGQKWTERPATTICHYHKNICVNKNIHGWWKTMQHLYGTKNFQVNCYNCYLGGNLAETDHNHNHLYICYTACNVAKKRNIVQI